MSAENPAVAALLETPELTGNELAMRLFWWVGHLATLMLLESHLHRAACDPPYCALLRSGAPDQSGNLTASAGTPSNPSSCQVLQDSG